MVAVSDAPGAAEFREFLPDETGTVPEFPETSTLIGTIIHNGTHRTVMVPVVTLDTDAMPYCDRDPAVVKIDVEGFEAWVLRGAEKLIVQRAAWLSIDIHAEPFGDGKATTEQSVRALLGQQGYCFAARPCAALHATNSDIVCVGPIGGNGPWNPYDAGTANGSRAGRRRSQN